jgi:hypothetical protein
LKINDYTPDDEAFRRFIICCFFSNCQKPIEEFFIEEFLKEFLVEFKYARSKNNNEMKININIYEKKISIFSKL